tara:strand:+ start:209 stop:784 length:576 start_codon:yes stop_codon:yes gene_type:complete
MKAKVLLVVLIFFYKINLNAAEAGMPQLDPTYWFSQAFWLILIFSLLYISIAKLFIPKIKDNLDDRENKIKDDLDEAKELNELAEKKNLEYENMLIKAKKDVAKILLDSKNQLDKSINSKKVAFEKDLENQIRKVENEIFEAKKKSANKINLMSEEISSQIIEEVTGHKPNNATLKKAVIEISKERVNKNL